jgi:adenylate cyclase class 2
MSNTHAKEIELKVFVGDTVDHVRDLAREFNWSLVETTSQADTYYTSIHKDFIASEECLRIRVTPGRKELTWKPPTSATMRERGQYWKEEVDLEISNQEDVVRTLLDRLDFVEYVTVRKQREVYKIDDNSLIALDHVDSLGWFAEIETFGEDGPKGAAKNDEIASALGIDSTRRVNVPYRDMVKEGRVYSNPVR